jgi:hypothetical protein
LIVEQAEKSNWEIGPAFGIVLSEIDDINSPSLNCITDTPHCIHQLKAEKTFSICAIIPSISSETEVADSIS